MRGFELVIGPLRSASRMSSARPQWPREADRIPDARASTRQGRAACGRPVLRIARLPDCCNRLRIRRVFVRRYGLDRDKPA